MQVGSLSRLEELNLEDNNLVTIPSTFSLG